MAGFLTRRRGDEFYTRREDVDKMLAQYLPIFQRPGVRVLCPCDTHASAYVQFFREHGVGVTWSDELDYDRFDFAEFDFVVTNPPFSLLQDFMRKILDAGAGGHIVMPIASLVGGQCERALRQGWMATDEGVPTSFLRPDSASMPGSRIACLRSPALAHNVWTGSKRREVLSAERAAECAEETMEGVVRYARVSACPERWTGAIAVPISWACVRYEPSKHEILGHSGFHRLDGTETFNSFIVRCRDEATKKED